MDFRWLQSGNVAEVVEIVLLVDVEEKPCSFGRSSKQIREWRQADLLSADRRL